jgi:hypothetical protein
MRSHTTTESRPRRKAQYRVLALTLGICALAIPASVAGAQSIHSGYSTPNAITGGSSDSSQPIDGWSYSLLNPPENAPGPQSGSGGSSDGAQDYGTPNAILGSDGLGEPTLVSGPPPDTADGFDWASAAVGAGAALALVALGGAALLTVRRRTAISPSAPTS